jgi:DNA polymerase alpha subunit A
VTPCIWVDVADKHSAVLKEILSGEATEYVVNNIHSYLTTLGETVRSGTMPIDDFIIFKVCFALD